MRVHPHNIWLRGVALAVLMSAPLLGTPVVAEQSLRITLDEAREAAGNALIAGRNRDALILADGVLLGDPEDLSALFIRARALSLLGDDEAALSTARRAWLATSGEEMDHRDRFFAAMMMAQTRARAGRKGQAQLWLRRAAEIAPEDDLRTAAVNDFRQVRRATPWRLHLDLYARPSDNLNNAPDEDVYAPNGWKLANAPKPLSGERYGGSAQLRYTLPRGTRSRVHLLGIAAASGVRFSESARDAGAKAGDHTQATLGGGLSFEWIAPDARSLSRVDLIGFRLWQGGKALADITRLDFATQSRVAEHLTLGFRLGGEDLRRLDSANGSSQRREAGMTLTQGLEGAAVSVDVTFGQTLSAAHNIGRRDAEVALSYHLEEQVAGMLPRMTLTRGFYDYEKPWLDSKIGPDREDRSWRLGVDVLLPELDYYGFAPEVGVSFTDRKSNYGLYQTRSTDLRLGLKSVF